MSSPRSLLLFSKPARAGEVKTRLIGALTPEEAAELHEAFLEDLLSRLAGGAFDLRVAWALAPDEPLPHQSVAGIRQQGSDLGERLFNGLLWAAREHALVAAVGSDHPDLPLPWVHQAFERLEQGAEIVLGPTDDGGYYLVGFRAESLHPRVFAGIPWSTSDVLEATLLRCGELEMQADLLPQAADVDTPADLERLARSLVAEDRGCPRTRALLGRWGRLPIAES